MNRFQKLQKLINQQNSSLKKKAFRISNLENELEELREFKGTWPLRLKDILEALDNQNKNYQQLFKVDIPTDGKTKAEKTTIYLDDLIAIHFEGKKKHLYLSKHIKIESEGSKSNVHSTKMNDDEIIKSIDPTTFYMFKIGKSIWINLSYYSHFSISNRQELVISLNPKITIMQDDYGKQLAKLFIKGKVVDMYLKQRKLFEEFDSFRKMSFRSEFEKLLK